MGKIGGQQVGVGRVVHYVGHDGNHQAAIITRFREESVDLVVFDAGENQGTVRWLSEVPWGDNQDNEHGTWHWPERGE